MAWARKKSGGRREPMFGLAASLAELRLGPQDRVTVADDKPKTKAAKPRSREPVNEQPRERKPSASRGGAKRKSKGRARGVVYRLFYWGAVLGLWAAIAVVGLIIYVGAHLPPIQ
jgi:penicillin-binding protein 1A